jgi:hypothetical protein
LVINLYQGTITGKQRGRIDASILAVAKIDASLYFLSILAVAKIDASLYFLSILAVAKIDASLYFLSFISAPLTGMVDEGALRSRALHRINQ